MTGYQVTALCQVDFGGPGAKVTYLDSVRLPDITLLTTNGKIQHPVNGKTQHPVNGTIQHSVRPEPVERPPKAFCLLSALLRQ